MSIYKGSAKLKAYRGNYHPAHVYMGDKKLTGWHNETVSGKGRAECSDTYNDTTGGRLYADTVLIPPSDISGDETPAEPDILNPFIIEHTKDLTVTVERDGHEPHTVTIPGDLYAIPDGNGGYIARDSVDLDTMEIVRECGRVIPDSNTGWVYATRNGDYLRFYYSRQGDVKTGQPDARANLISNYFKGECWNTAKLAQSNNVHTYSGDNRLGVVVHEKYLATADLAGWKEWLREHSLEFVYQKKTPAREPLDIAPLPSFYPATVITCTDSDGNPVEMEMVLKQQD